MGPTATAPVRPTASPDPATDPAALRDLTIPQLLSYLRPSFQNSDFEEVERILVSREASLESELAEALAIKKLEGIEHAREAEASALEAEKYRAICAGFEEQAERTKESIAMLAKEISELEKAKKSAVDEAEEWKRKYWELDAKFKAKEGAKELARKEDRVGRSGAKIMSGDVIEISDDEDKIDVDDRAQRPDFGVLEDNESDDEKRIFSITPKRKCVARVVTSDSEGEEEDDLMPIGRLKERRLGKTIDRAKESKDSPANNSYDFIAGEEDVTPSKRRRLFRLRECGGEIGGESGVANSHNLTPDSTDGVGSRQRARVHRRLAYSNEKDDEKEGADEGKETDDSGSDSEGESLGGFIVNDSDAETLSSSDGKGDTCSSDSSKEDLDLNKVLSKIRREKETKEWEYEADMLASFAKDSELCMKAVCALYRQQTSEEQSIKGTILRNERGFNKLDAERGSMIAEFLTDGNPFGQLKSIEELNRYNPNGVEYCRKLASFYSKQLFKIYQSKEDPFFLPS